MYVLGIDIGTGGSRALLVNREGRIVASHTETHEPMSMPQPLWAEQQPEDWWKASRAAIRQVIAASGATGAQIEAIGLSGQMHGLVLLDGQDQVIRPSLIWCDQRSQDQVDAAHAKMGRDAVVKALANPLVTGFTLPKLLWVRDHEPAHYERAKRVLLPKDYVRLQLTGDYATEVSDASGMGMFDVANRRWSNEIMEVLGVDKSLLPVCYESQEITGRVTMRAAEETGLAAGTPVVGGGGDQAASAVGNGIVEPGIVSCTLGTSGVVFAHLDEPSYDPAGRVHTFCHAVPNKWHVMGVTQAAGLSLQWFRETLAPSESYDALLEEAAQAPAGSDGLFWLPYLMGERTPHLDAAIRGGWIGLTARHRRADLVRAVIEGVCYSQKDGLDIMESLGVPLSTVRFSGGGAKNGFWRQTLANVLNKRVVTLDTQEGSAYGAALLALVGCGAFASVPEVCQAAIREVEATEVDAEQASRYVSGHRAYQALYPALAQLFRG